MGTGYTRADVTNNISNSNLVDADDLDAEFDAIVAAFNSSTGHTHDGTTAEGAPVTVLGPAQEAIQDATAFYPKTDDTYDLGKSGAEWKDIYIDGVAYIDTLDLAGGQVTSIDTDLSSVSASDNTLASAKAIKTYVDSLVTAQDLDFQADTGGALSIDLDSETLTIAGGTGIDTSGSGNTVTVAIDSTVATLSDTQTLTNKSINLASNTLTGTLSEFNTALSGADFVSIAGAETLTNKTLTSPALTGSPDFSAAANKSTIRSDLGLEIGKDVQAHDNGLTSIAGLTTAADKMIYTTASDTYAVADLTSAGRALLDDADAEAQRTTLGLGGLATLDTVSASEVDDGAITTAKLASGEQMTTTNVNTAIASSSLGAVGTYAFLGVSGYTVVPGALVAGSILRYISVGSDTGDSNDNIGRLSGVAPSGTWRCMGYLESTARPVGTLFLRVT